MAQQTFSRVRIPRCRFGFCAAVVLLSFPAFGRFTKAEELKQARVTQVVKEVNLLHAQTAPKPAAVSDEVRAGTAVRTGAESRAELTFADQTLTRLGANTLFSMSEGARTVDLGGGAMLLYVPKNAGGATIKTAAVTAAITGTTCLVENHPKSFSKLIFLEGSGRAFLRQNPRESVVLHPGDMLTVKINATHLPMPQKINLRLLRRTSSLLYPRLPSEGLMRAAEEQQKEDVETSPELAVDPTSHDAIDQRANAIQHGKGPGAPGGP